MRCTTALCSLGVPVPPCGEREKSPTEGQEGGYILVVIGGQYPWVLGRGHPCSPPEYTPYCPGSPQITAPSLTPETCKYGTDVRLWCRNQEHPGQSEMSWSPPAQSPTSPGFILPPPGSGNPSRGTCVASSFSARSVCAGVSCGRLLADSCCPRDPAQSLEMRLCSPLCGCVWS